MQRRCDAERFPKWTFFADNLVRRLSVLRRIANIRRRRKNKFFRCIPKRTRRRRFSRNRANPKR